MSTIQKTDNGRLIIACEKHLQNLQNALRDHYLKGKADGHPCRICEYIQNAIKLTRGILNQALGEVKK